LNDFRKTIGAYCTRPVKNFLLSLSNQDVERATEIRLRAGQKAAVTGGRRIFSQDIVPAADIRLIADAMLGHAIHARQEELRQGFVTLPGGYRAGICGRAVVRDGSVIAMQDISSIAIRIAREVPGAARALMPLIAQEGRLSNVLILSPPGLGKTTLLRDIARSVSEIGYFVSIIDERSEIAACVQGVPSLNVGPNTDVLDGCPKAQGIPMMLRAMSPQVMITDELGGPADASAVAEASKCGVCVIASAHGMNFADARRKRMLREVLNTGVFDLIVSLRAVGEIGAIYKENGEKIAQDLFCRDGGHRLHGDGDQLVGEAFKKGGCAAGVGARARQAGSGLVVPRKYNGGDNPKGGRGGRACGGQSGAIAGGRRDAGKPADAADRGDAKACF